MTDVYCIDSGCYTWQVYCINPRSEIAEVSFVDSGAVFSR